MIVVSLRAKEQVAAPDAGRVVAAMKHVQAVWHRRVGVEHPGDTMRLLASTFPPK
jgi:hypothetical protein